MDIAAFYASLRTSIGRGSSVDADIPLWCAEAVNELETEGDFKWMEKEVDLTVNPGSGNNRVALPSDRVKWVDFVRPVVSTGYAGGRTYGKPLLGVSGFDFLSVDEQTAPGGFYLDGVAYIVFDGIPQASTVFHMAYAEYTLWPADTSQTPAVLARHPAGLKSLCMSVAARNLRDARLAELWSQIAERAKVAMWMSDGTDGKSGMKHRRGMAQSGQ